MSKEEVDISETIIIVSGVIGVLIAFLIYSVLFKTEKRKKKTIITQTEV